LYDNIFLLQKGRKLEPGIPSWGFKEGFEK